VIATETPRQRALEALETLGREFGVADHVRGVEGAEDWQGEAIAMLAEAVAGLALDTRPGLPAHRRKRRTP
jgi:hypothetical protein